GDLYKFQVANKRYDDFIKSCLRTYGSLFEDYVAIKESELGLSNNMSKSKVIEILERLDKLEVVNYEKQSNMPRVTFTRPRPDQNALFISKENYQKRKSNAFEKMEA